MGKAADAVMFDFRCLRSDGEAKETGKAEAMSGNGMRISFTRAVARCIVGIDEHGA